MSDKITNIDLKQDELDIRGTLIRLLKYWYLFGIIIVMFIIGAIAYLKYTPSIYSVKGTILIRDKSNKLGAENLIESLELLKPGTNLDNEIGILKSYSLMQKVFDKLNFDVSYYSQGRVKTVELYKTNPYTVEIDTLYPQIVNTPFNIDFLTDSTYRLSLNAANFRPYVPFTQNFSQNKVKSFNYSKVHHFGDTVQSQYFSFIIRKNNDLVLNYRKSIDAVEYFYLRSRDDLINNYRNKVDITPQKRYSSILGISINGIIYEKDIDFVNMLMEEYITQSLDEKNQVASNTINFIDEQIGYVSSELYAIEEKLKMYREDNSFLDIRLTATSAFENYQMLLKEKSRLVVKDKYYNYLKNTLDSNEGLQDIIAPSAIGVDDPLMINLVNGLNKLYSEKAAMEYSVEPDNPSLIILNDKITNAKKLLAKNIESIRKSSKIAIDDLNSRMEEVDGNLKKMPQTEQEYLAIQRLFKLNEHIYNYLMEKKAEAGIAKASNISDHRIVDYARLTSKYPISPNTKLVYAAALIGGLITTLLIIGVITLLNDKIEGKTDLANRTNIPIIATIGKKRNISNIPVMESPKSMIAEAFRTLRINLQYLNKANGVRIIGLTSTVSGEGKTFCSINLAATIALSGSKTVVLGADLRKPVLHKHLGSADNKNGITNYLIKDVELENIIEPTSVPGLDFISSGPIPPNPTELLETDRFTEMIEKLKEIYDYIIIDSPPVGLVSDYLIMQRVVDTTLYVVRADYTKKSFIDNINLFSEQNKIHDFSILLNATENKDFRYYEYGYYEQDPENSGLVGKLLKTVPWLRK